MTDRSDQELRAAIAAWLCGTPPDAPLVVVPIYQAYGDVVDCVERLLRHTPPAIPLLALDDASPDPRIAAFFAALTHHGHLRYARRAENRGFVATANLAFAAAAPRDVVIVNSDVMVPAGWLERLQAAAYHRSNVATATPLTNHGSILSVPQRNAPTHELPPGLDVDEVDRRVQAAARRTRPVIPTCIGHCTYVRRLALDAVGEFDMAFSPGYGEEVDFSLRSVQQGFCHVAADDLFVEHRGARSFSALGGDWRRRLQEGHEELIKERYPWYYGWMASAAADATGPLGEVLARARAAIVGRRIAIDATCIGGSDPGTYGPTLELVRTLARLPGRAEHLTVILRDEGCRPALLDAAALVDAVAYVGDFAPGTPPSFDLVHRPFQVYAPADLALLQRVATRVVVSQLDCIAYANPSYAASDVEWRQYRALTGLAFALADGIAYNSADVALDCAHHGLVIAPERSTIAYNGVEHNRRPWVTSLPAGAAAFAGRPFLLMLGTSYRHKNRIFALRLLAELLRRYDWPGGLVFAGPDVAHGSSQPEEAELRRASPELADRVHDLGAVAEAEKRWLLDNAALVLYPSVYEGFGLVGFEAAAHETPALTTRLTSLGEVMGAEVAAFESLDPVAGAALVWRLLSEPEAARAQVAAINRRAADFAWPDVAARMAEFYRHILELPPRSRMPAPGEAALRALVVALAEPAHLAPGPTPTTRHGALAEWRRRISFGLRVLREEGFQSFRREVRRYVRWRTART